MLQGSCCSCQIGMGQWSRGLAASVKPVLPSAPHAWPDPLTVMSSKASVLAGVIAASGAIPLLESDADLAHG